jgi:integral membrane protein (TIGR01906 family)
VTGFRVRVAVLTVGLALAGLIGLVAVYDGGGTYRDIARAEGVTGATFRIPPDSRWNMDLNGLVALHERTLAYVLGDAPELPTFATTGLPLFDDNERSHMRDVRVLFGTVKIAFVAGLVLGFAVLRWTDRALRVRLLRDAAIGAGIAVSAVAIAAVVAFDPLFLLFHEIFFPQGNFLFGPDSNLLILYPDAYWYGVTLRIGVTFIAAMAAVALAATATLRRARR